MRDSPTPETEFVLGLLQRVGNPDEVDSRLREISRSDPDWNVILDLVSRHRLHAVFRRTVNETEVAAPKEITDMLEARFRENSIGNLQHCRQLFKLVELFDSNDIAALPYKGPVLAEAVYGSVGDRSFGDLDFLVDTEDVVPACDLLEQHGYDRLNFTNVSVETLISGTPFRWGKEFRFIDSNENLPVELRFGFIGSSQLGTKIFSELWERRTTEALTGRTLSTLSPEDRALLLLVHGTKHGWRQLSWVYDVALAYEQNIDWEIVLMRAKKYRWLNAVLYGNAVINRLTGLSIPEPIQAELDSSAVCVWGGNRTAARLRDGLDADLTHLEPLTTAMFLQDSPYGSLTEAINEVLAPRKSDYEWISLPPFLYPLYYPIRLFRLGINTSKRLVGK